MNPRVAAMFPGQKCDNVDDSCPDSRTFQTYCECNVGNSRSLGKLPPLLNPCIVLVVVVVTLSKSARCQANLPWTTLGLWGESPHDESLTGGGVPGLEPSSNDGDFRKLWVSWAL